MLSRTVSELSQLIVQILETLRQTDRWTNRQNSHRYTTSAFHAAR